MGGGMPYVRLTHLRASMSLGENRMRVTAGFSWSDMLARRVSCRQGAGRRRRVAGVVEEIGAGVLEARMYSTVQDSQMATCSTDTAPTHHLDDPAAVHLDRLTVAA